MEILKYLAVLFTIVALLMALLQFVLSANNNNKEVLKSIETSLSSPTELHFSSSSMVNNKAEKDEAEKEPPLIRTGGGE